MDTGKLGAVVLDHAKLERDIDVVKTLRFHSTYSEFICGVWESCALWNRSGSSDHTSIFHYEGLARKTAHGEKLVYIAELVEELFHAERLKFVRLVKLKHNSVIIPHKDFIETGRDFLRVHIPLQTDEHCFNSEENTVYQMRLGEVWNLNASVIHSAASFSSEDRLHLILDFEGGCSLQSIMKFQITASGIPRENLIVRKWAPREALGCLHSLSQVVDRHNFTDVLSMLIKMHFRSSLSARDVYGLLFRIVDDSNDPMLAEMARTLYGHCMNDRELSLPAEA
jgi:hypothetical protein